jgi:hypothetical protein
MPHALRTDDGVDILNQVIRGFRLGQGQGRDRDGEGKKKLFHGFKYSRIAELLDCFIAGEGAWRILSELEFIEFKNYQNSPMHDRLLSESEFPEFKNEQNSENSKILEILIQTVGPVPAQQNRVYMVYIISAILKLMS